MKRLLLFALIIALFIPTFGADETRIQLGRLILKPTTPGTILPTYETGKYLTNNGTTLSWGAISFAGYLRADGTIPLTANWDVGSYTLTALRFISDQATGTAPFTVASTTVVTNLNASLLGGNAASAFVKADGTVPLTANWPMGAFTLSQATWQGVAVAAAYGGTGQTVYAVGDLLYASTTTALSKLAGVAVGQVLVSGGVGVAPAWTGNITVNNITIGQYGVINPTSSGFMKFSSGIVHSGAAGKSSIYLAEDTFSNTTGATIPVRIVPTYNQASGDAANTDLLINRTETAIGSGTQRLISAGTGGGTYVEKFGVSNTGFVYSAPVTITAGSGTGLTVNSTGNSIRQVYKVTVTYAGFSAAATTADKTIATLPAKTKIVGFYADTTAAFTGGAVSATALTVGKSAGGVEYIATHDVLSAAIVRGLADADMGTELTRAAAIQGGAVVNWAATTTVSARITTTTANTNALTAGSVTFYIVTERY